MGGKKSQGTTVHLSSEDADVTAMGAATYVKIGGVVQVGAPSGEAADIDVTDLDSEAKEYLTGIPDNGNIEIGLNFDDGDAGQDNAIDALEAQERRWLKITWSTGAVWSIKALVKKYSPSAGVDSKIDAAVSLRLSGAWDRS